MYGLLSCQKIVPPLPCFTSSAWWFLMWLNILLVLAKHVL